MTLLNHLEATFRGLGERAGPHGLSEVPREVQNEVSRGLAKIHADVKDFSAKLRAWALAHPDRTFALLRCLQPILVTEDLAIVTRYDDVKEVLSRPEAFRVTYAPKMAAITGGS